MFHLCQIDKAKSMKSTLLRSRVDFYSIDGIFI